jgi:hypothetical protein
VAENQANIVFHHEGHEKSRFKMPKSCFGFPFMPFMPFMPFIVEEERLSLSPPDTVTPCP